MALLALALRQILMGLRRALRRLFLAALDFLVTEFVGQSRAPVSWSP